MKHPGRWLWLFLLVPIIFGLARLRFDVEVFNLLPADLQVVQGLKLYQEHFANARELIITVRASEPEQAEQATRSMVERLRVRTDLVASVTWEPPWLEHPGQVGELLAYLWFNQRPGIFQQLTNRLVPSKLVDVLAATHEQLTTTFAPDEIARLQYDPYGLTRLPEDVAGAAPSLGQGQEVFSSRDGKFRIVFVKAARDLPGYPECAAWLKEVRALTASPGVSVGYTGRPAFVAEVAGGMQHDVQISVGGTAVIIALLFWLAHRRIKPMLWLLTLLALILGSTLALGGLIFGTINVVSMGFAAILLGLAVDYAVVHYQEALAHPDLSIPEIRSAIAPSIFWAAVTTITAFLVLNFGGLPGLGQLGTLVGLGVALSACIMIFEFLPPLFPERRRPKLVQSNTQLLRNRPLDPQAPSVLKISTSKIRVVFAITVVLILLGVIVLLRGFPTVDPTANALRPRNSPAYRAMDEIKRELNQGREPFWVIVRGDTESDVASKLDRLQETLGKAESNQLVIGFTLPTALWPRPEYQTANRPASLQLVSQRELFKAVALTNGFKESALGLTEQMLNAWERAAHTTGVFWPSNNLVQWIFEKVTARSTTQFFAMGLINPMTVTDPEGDQRLAALQSELPQDGVWLSGWELLGAAIFARVKSNMWFVLTPMVGLVFLSLLLAFRRAGEVLLSLGVLALSGLCLLTVMRLFGWSWNLLNLMALPLILGTGVDYSIFMQLALRRHHGDLTLAYRSVGRALLLCGGTACAGFGSLAFSTNTGMGSLGKICAVGIASNMIISIFLLPTWWALAQRRLNGQGSLHNPPGPELPPDPLYATRVVGIQKHAPSKLPAPGEGNDSTFQPSSFYRKEIWQFGLWLVRLIPLSLCRPLGRLAAILYWTIAKRRREIVIQNLLPAFATEHQRAKQTARSLFQHMAVKVIDLWRYEAGLSIDSLFGENTGWEHFAEAQSQKRGVLLLTPHLGNWEFGGPWLARHGIALQVITMAEPTQDFTRLRQTSRARWNIETLVIGEDPFAFLEVIKRLENGATVALLVDRPPRATSIDVQLFGKPFAASIAAAELARASGCVLLPVYLPRANGAYAAHVLPAISYDRAALRGRDSRRELTQKIISAFEPVIRQHLDQWYHFVPVWRF
jgi:uncharacterized protein